jgi:hypothetical protein
MMMCDPSEDRRPDALLAALLLGVASCGRPASAAGPDKLHGAAPAAEQQKALSALITHDVTKPPPGVDVEAWAALVPDDNEPTPARVELGRKLYFDPRLSADGTVSCSTCHDATGSFTDRRPVSEGIRDQLGHRNADHDERCAPADPVLGRARTLEDQAKLPMLNPVEMGMPRREGAVTDRRSRAHAPSGGRRARTPGSTAARQLLVRRGARRSPRLGPRATARPRAPLHPRFHLDHVATAYRAERCGNAAFGCMGPAPPVHTFLPG